MRRARQKEFSRHRIRFRSSCGTAEREREPQTSHKPQLASVTARLLEFGFVSFLLLIGRSRRPSHESNNYSIL